MSNTEHLVLSKLLEKKNCTVTYDEIADILWPDDADNKFSLQAIAKVIERIRYSIHSSGIKQQLIYNIKEQGYLIIN